MLDVMTLCHILHPLNSILSVRANFIFNQIANMILAMGMEHVRIVTVDTVARVTMDTKGHRAVKVCIYMTCCWDGSIR